MNKKAFLDGYMIKVSDTYGRGVVDQWEKGEEGRVEQWGNRDNYTSSARWSSSPPFTATGSGGQGSKLPYHPGLTDPSHGTRGQRAGGFGSNIFRGGGGDTTIGEQLGDRAAGGYKGAFKDYLREYFQKNYPIDKGSY